MLLCVACSFAQKQNTTPVPILKQINRHNEDGSYSYGYEAADGSFKIETKAANGDVKGKYGYVDADGNVREISYGADKNGFNPEVKNKNFTKSVTNFPGFFKNNYLSKAKFWRQICTSKSFKKN